MENKGCNQEDTEGTRTVEVRKVSSVLSMLNLLAAGINFVHESGAQARSGQKHEIQKSLNRWYRKPLAYMRLTEMNVQDMKRIKFKMLKKVYIQGVDKGSQAYKRAD